MRTYAPITPRKRSKARRIIESYHCRFVWNIRSHHATVFKIYRFAVGLIRVKRNLYSIKGYICERLERYEEYPDGFYLLDEDGGSSYNGEYTQHWHYVYGVGYGVFSNWWIFVESYSD